MSSDTSDSYSLADVELLQLTFAVVTGYIHFASTEIITAFTITVHLTFQLLPLIFQITVQLTLHMAFRLLAVLTHQHFRCFHGLDMY